MTDEQHDFVEIEVGDVEAVPQDANTTEIVIRGAHFGEGLIVSAGDETLSPFVVSPNEIRVTIANATLEESTRLEIGYSDANMTPAEIDTANFRIRGASIGKPANSPGQMAQPDAGMESGSGLAGDTDTEYRHRID